MNKLFDKLIVFMLCVVFYVSNYESGIIIIPVLSAVILSAALSYFDNDNIKVFGFIIFIVICIYWPGFMYFLPLICYDIIMYRIKLIWILAFFPFLINAGQTDIISNIILAVFFIAAYLLKHRTLSFENTKQKYIVLRDNSKEMSMLYEEKNKALMENQDYEIRLATLNERNRIARDIHDNVGHLLSSTILQIGALLATSDDVKTKSNLKLINSTLTSAMDSVRHSVHDLHEQSIDLQTEVNTLIEGFKFCPVALDYDIESSLPNNLKYCFISIIKEALSNISKHSIATKGWIVLREHPALYQLIIKDNGTKRSENSDGGIGLTNISERVAAFKGNINIGFDNGFRIFISIPKE